MTNCAKRKEKGIFAGNVLALEESTKPYGILKKEKQHSHPREMIFSIVLVVKYETLGFD